MMRVRFYLGAELHEERWVKDSRQAGEDVDRHMFEVLKHPGKEWMVEVYNSDEPEERAYLRFGSSPHGMKDPIAINPKDVV